MSCFRREVGVDRGFSELSGTGLQKMGRKATTEHSPKSLESDGGFLEHL